MPSTKPLRSGTWAITLLAMITSAGPTLGPQPAGQLGAEELRAGSGCPAASAARPDRAPGRRPSTGMPRSAKFFSR